MKIFSEVTISRRGRRADSRLISLKTLGNCFMQFGQAESGPNSSHDKRLPNGIECFYVDPRVA